MEKQIYGWTDWLRNQLISKKLNSIVGVILLAVLSTLIATITAQFGMKGGIITLGGIIGLGTVLTALFNQYIGVYMILILGSFVTYLSKIIDLPFGTSLDLFLVVMTLGVLMKQTYKRDLQFLNTPLTIPILIWIGFNLIQVINPAAVSKLAWVYTVRSMAVLILLYFIACHAFNSYRRIINVFKFMLGIAFLSALYGFVQEYIGFTQFELNWLYSDPKRFQLIFQWARLRVFSFFSDPTNYGMFMSYFGVMCTILLIGPYKLWQKAVLGIAALSMFWAIGLAGSRTPVLLVPFGFFIFTLLTLNKKVILTMCILIVLGGGFVMKSTSNAIIFRIQSAFLIDKSADTMNVRFRNQKMIQPFIQRHPFGAGLGSAGEWGARFAPDSILAKFPPDSGLVRIAVELGWIGLIIYSLLLLKIIHFSTYCYLRVKHPKVKMIYLALTIMMFMLILASYPQEAIVQLPTSIFFYVSLAIIARLKDFEHEVWQEESNLNTG